MQSQSNQTEYGFQVQEEDMVDAAALLAHQREAYQEVPGAQKERQVNIRTAEWLAKKRPATGSGGRRRGRRPNEPVFSDLFWSHVMAESRVVKRVTCDYRMKAFGNPDIPFKNWSGALKWLLEQQKRGRRTGVSERGRLGVMKKHRAVMAQLPSLPIGFNISVPLKRLLVRFPDHQGWPAFTYADTPQLVAIAEGAQKLARITGCSVQLGTAHLLAGVLPGGSYRIDWHFGSVVPWADVRIYPGALKQPMFQRILQQLRREVTQYLPLQEAGLLTDKDAMLLDLVRGFRPPPLGRGKGKLVGYLAYWRRLTDLWSRRYPDRRCKAGALRKRWERIPGGVKSLLWGGLDAELM